MRKGDISKAKALTVGLDAGILVKPIKPESPIGWALSKIGRYFGYTDQLDGVLSCCQRHNTNIVVCGTKKPYNKTEQNRIETMMAVLSINDFVWHEDEIDLGNNGLDGIDVYFTDNADFHFSFRFKHNVRFYYGPNTVSNYLRNFD